MNKKIVIIATIILSLFSFTMLGGCNFNMNKGKYQDSSLQSFSIKTGGGMNGGQDILSVCSDMNNNIVTVYKSVNNMWYLNPQAELYVVDSSLIDEIKQIIIDEKLYNAPELPLLEMQVLDAPITSYNVSFADGEYFSYSTSQELSSRIYSANNKINAIIEEYCSNATAYPTIYVDADGEYTNWKEQGEITIDCSNESSFFINLNIYNGRNDITELTGNVTFSKLDGDKVIYTDILVENYEVDVYAQSNEYITVELPFDHYPEEGTYKIEYAGYETMFEMKVYKIE